MPFYSPFIYVASNHRLFFTGNQVFFIIIYSSWACGEIGRRAGFRFQWGNPWGFKSPPAHHEKLLMRTIKCAFKNLYVRTSVNEVRTTTNLRAGILCRAKFFSAAAEFAKRTETGGVPDTLIHRIVAQWPIRSRQVGFNPARTQRTQAKQKQYYLLHNARHF